MVVIKVENLSKKYIIEHNRAATGLYRYSSLRDSLAHSYRGIIERICHPLSPNRETTRLEEFWALKGINLEIEQGERVGIIGENGAGKSTLLKILSRITEPTTGKFTIKGRVASLLEVGTGFHPELTGRENIYLNGAVLGMSRKEIKRKFDQIVDFSGVEKFLDTPVKRYSSGMHVRLAFAVAAHLDPEILLIDEVLAVGDAEFQKKCLGKMNEVSTQGRTILFVSHNMAALRAICTKGILLSEGGLLLSSDIDQVINSYSLLRSKAPTFGGVVAGRIYIQKVILCNSDELELKSLDTDTDIYVNIFYEVRGVGRIGFTLNVSKEGNIFLQSMSNNDACFYEIKRKGNYRTICKIPRAFLNNGLFTLGLTVYEENYSNPIVMRDIFEFNIGDAPSVRKDYFGGYIGVVRPELLWETAPVSCNYTKTD